MLLRMRLILSSLIAGASALPVLSKDGETTLLSIGTAPMIAVLPEDAVGISPFHEDRDTNVMSTFSERLPSYQSRISNNQLTFDQCSAWCQRDSGNSHEEEKNCVLAFKMVGMAHDKRFGCLPKNSKHLCGTKFLCQKGFTCKENKCKKSESVDFALQKEWKKCSIDCAGRSSSEKCVRYFGRTKGEKILVSPGGRDQCFIDFGCISRTSQRVCGRKSVCETGFVCDDSKENAKPHCRRKQDMSGKYNWNKTEWLKCSDECGHQRKKCVRTFNWLGEKCKSNYACLENTRNACGKRSWCGTGYSCVTPHSGKEIKARCVRDKSGKASSWKYWDHKCKGQGNLATRFYAINNGKPNVRLGCSTKKDESKLCGNNSICEKGLYCREHPGNPAVCTVITMKPWFECLTWCQKNKSQSCALIFALIDGKKKLHMACENEENMCSVVSYCGSGYKCRPDSSGTKMCVVDNRDTEKYNENIFNGNDRKRGKDGIKDVNVYTLSGGSDPTQSKCPCVKVPKCAWCNRDLATCTNQHDFVCLNEFRRDFSVQSLLRQTKASETIFDVCAIRKGRIERHYTTTDGRCERKNLKKCATPGPSFTIQSYSGPEPDDATDSTCPCEERTWKSGNCYSFINPNDPLDKSCLEKYCEKSWKCVARQKVALLPQFSICRLKKVLKRVRKHATIYSRGLTCIEETVNRQQLMFFQTFTRGSAYW